LQSGLAWEKSEGSYKEVLDGYKWAFPHEDLLLRGNRIVIPSDLRQDTLHRLHKGLSNVVYVQMNLFGGQAYPVILILLFIICDTCYRDFQITMELMIPTKLPGRHWEKLASDLYKLKGTPYVIVVDYFSCCIQILKLTNATSASVILALKLCFLDMVFLTL